MLKEINLKEVGSVESSIAITRMEIDNANLEGITVLKLLHGYGSHGSGGVILKEVRKELSYLKKKKKIKDFFNGEKWNILDTEVIKILSKDKSIVGDSDLNRRNPGITIVVL